MDYGIIIDLETTGLDSSKDKIIEIGILEFAVDEAYKPAITNMYSCLEDPEQPVSPEITKITGLNDDLLKNNKINWDLVKQYFSRASIVIAHNAEFDLSFLAKSGKLNDLTTHWACSQKHIDWFKYGSRSKALNYIAADKGFVNPFAHRALFDCATTFRVVSPHFEELFGKSYEKNLRVCAPRTAYEKSEKMRSQYFKWNKDQRFWFKDIFESDLQNIRNFLSNEVYEGEDFTIIEELPSLDQLFDVLRR